MKRICTALALCAVIVLSGCGRNSIEPRWEEFSSALAAADTVGFTADIRAEYEDKSLEFTLSLEQTGDETAVTVVLPESLSGVKAVTHGGSRDLEYYGFIIDTGTLDGGLTPVGALPALIGAMRSGYADCFWREEGSAVVRLIASDELTVTLWLDEASFTPTHAELESGGRVTVFCDIRDWRLG